MDKRMPDKIVLIFTVSMQINIYNKHKYTYKHELRQTHTKA